MFRNLLILGFFISTGNIYAQPGRPLHPAAPPTSADLAPIRKMVTGSEIDYKEVGAPIPDFIVKSSQTPKLITNKDFQSKDNMFLMIFNPTCSHCEDMTELLEKNMALLNKTKILMVATPGMVPYMETFQKNHHIDQYPNIQIGIDSGHLIDRTFLYKMLPQINIYNKDRRLIKTFCGDTPIDSFKSFLPLQ